MSLVLNSLGDPATDADLGASMPKAPGGGVLSVDLLLAARQRGFEASLGPGDPAAVRTELEEGHAVILMLKLLDAPGRRRDVFHYVVVDGLDPARTLFRFQFGDGKARWAPLGAVEKSWKAAGHALFRVWPGDAGTQLMRALALEKTGHRAEARALYLRIADTHPTSVRAWTNLGNLEASDGRAAEAEAAYRRAIGVAPNDRDALNNLAWLLFEEGTRLPEAEALASKAAAQSGPEQAMALDTLGRIQLARSRCEVATRTFSEALAVVDASRSTRNLRPGLLLGRGDAERACGRLAAARASLEEALQADPDPSTAKAARSALESLPKER